MPAEPDLSRLGRTLGDPTRIRMLSFLMEGRALTAKELAHGAGVAPATGTAHLQRLLADALVIVRTQGRHKYFQLASPQVAHCVESLMVIAQPAAFAAAAQPAPIHQARFCYDHLAGRIGTGITAALLERKVLRASGRDYVLTGAGGRWFEGFGIEPAAVAAQRRRFACACLDWSERQDHLGGALGAALAQRLLALGWLKRRTDSRVVTVTKPGALALATHFGLRLD